MRTEARKPWWFEDCHGVSFIASGARVLIRWGPQSPSHLSMPLSAPGLCDYLPEILNNSDKLAQENLCGFDACGVLYKSRAMAAHARWGSRLNAAQRSNQGPGLRHAVNHAAELRVLQQRPWWQKELSEGSVETMTRHLRFSEKRWSWIPGLILG